MIVTDTKAYRVAPSLGKTADTQKRLVEINSGSPAAKKSRLNQILSEQANILWLISTKLVYRISFTANFSEEQKKNTI